MATNLSTTFGTSELRVAPMARDAQWQLNSFAGAHGLTAQCMGSRGYALIVSGRLAAYGATYAAARSALQAIIDILERLQWSYAADYSWGNDTYSSVIWEKFDLLPSPDGKLFHYTADSYCIADFRMIGRSLL